MVFSQRPSRRKGLDAVSRLIGNRFPLLLTIAFLGLCGLMFWQLSLLKSTVNESAGNELLPAFTVMAALTALVLAGVGLVVAGLRKSSQQAQRLAEETAQTSELILNSAAEGIFCVDRNGRITMANPAAAKMTRWGLPELIGEDAGAWLGKDGLQSLRCPEEESSRAAMGQETFPGSPTRSVFSEKMVRVST